MQKKKKACDRIPSYRLHVSTTCKWALSLVFPSIRCSQEQISWVCVSAWYAVWSVTNRMLSVVRVNVRHTHPLRYQSPLSRLSLIHPLFLPTHPSHPSFLPQALPFICLSSADFPTSISPPPSLSPLHLSLSLPSASFSVFLFLLCPYSPVFTSSCLSAAYSVAPSLPSLWPSLSCSTFLSPSHLSFSSHFHIHPFFSPPWRLSIHSSLPLCPLPHLCLIHCVSHLIFSMSLYELVLLRHCSLHLPSHPALSSTLTLRLSLLLHPFTCSQQVIFIQWSMSIPCLPYSAIPHFNSPY